MVEEPSMTELLNIILPQILPDDVEKLIITHNGQNDLQRSIPRKLRGWQNPNDRFIIVHDQDSKDCVQLKTDLVSLCDYCRNEILIRIVCNELESWYLGDLPAVSQAYGKDYSQLVSKRKYRLPDKLRNAKQELRKIIPTYQPIDGAKKNAAYMNVNANTSHSFNTFVSGVKKTCSNNGLLK